jgi:flagellar hook protein FlgE
MNAGKATTTMSLSANLDAGATVGSPSGTYAAPVQVVDSLGATHTLTATFTKTGANKWDYAVTLPGSDSKTGSDVQVAKGSLTFASDGTLDPTTAPVTLKVAGLANGAADQNIDWSLVDGKTGLITQYAQKSGLSATKQDGVLAGQITNVGLSDGGQIVAHYSSGQQQVIGQLALAAITNPDSLTSAGNNNLAPTPGTSEAAIGAAGSGGRGNVVAGALEASTVDIATEFTNLITFQRSYSADSRVLTTGDEMLQDVLNVKR